MLSGEKIKIYALSVLIFLAAAFLFFHFRKSDSPKNITALVNNKNIENSQVATPKEKENVSSNDSGMPKTMPTKIPILMYHYIREYSNSNDLIGINLSVSPQKFEEQVSWLRENSYQTVFPEYFINPQPISFKPVILSFDDGYQDAYDSAFPILQKYQMSGEFYLIVDKIGAPGYLTWDEISEMQKVGMQFGSHTLTHPDLRNLTGANLEKEISGSKSILEEKLGQDITDFCYPSGKYNEEVLKIIQSTGYETAMTTDAGIANSKDNPLLLKRLRITNEIKFQNILAK